VGATAASQAYDQQYSSKLDPRAGLARPTGGTFDAADGRAGDPMIAAPAVTLVTRTH
jgi:hypothetical protein